MVQHVFKHAARVSMYRDVDQVSQCVISMHRRPDGVTLSHLSSHLLAMAVAMCQ